MINLIWWIYSDGYAIKVLSTFTQLNYAKQTDDILMLMFHYILSQHATLASISLHSATSC